MWQRADTGCLDVAVVGGQNDHEAMGDQPIKKRRQKIAVGPSANLIVEPSLTEFGAVSQLVDRADHEAKHREPWIGEDGIDLI